MEIFMLKNVLFSLLISWLFSLTAYAAPTDQPLVMTPENTIILRGEVRTQSVSEVILRLNEIESNEVILFINSPGGSVLAGNQLTYALQTTNKKVTCIANMAASMAFAILQSCGTRAVLPQSIIMQHVATYGVDGEAPKNVSMVKFLQRMLRKSDEVQAQRIGISYEDFKRKTRNDWWLVGSDTVDNGVADKVVNAVCSPELVKKRSKQTVNNLFFSLEIEWSGCPLIEYPTKITKPESPFGIKSKSAVQEYANFLKIIKLRDSMVQWMETGKKPFKVREY